MKCKCPDWEEGKNGLDAFFDLGYSHGLHYKGPVWKFCPWCGGPLLKRIQRKRSRGWKMPENTVYVGRPTKWGNPHQSGDVSADVTAFLQYIREKIKKEPALYDLAELAGKDLACWCSLDQPCHADTLLSLANGGIG